MHAAPPPASNARDAKLAAKFRLLGQDVLPFTSEKQNAVIVGVANALGGGILASDIMLTVYATYNVGSPSKPLLLTDRQGYRCHGPEMPLISSSPTEYKHTDKHYYGLVLQSITAYGTSGGRRLLQQQTPFPAADVGLNITTSKSLADSQAKTLLDATNQTYLLSSTIGSQGTQHPKLLSPSSLPQSSEYQRAFRSQ